MAYYKSAIKLMRDRALSEITGNATLKAAALANLGLTDLAAGTVTSPVITTGLTASGSASNDFSASTGTFKTSAGANTLSGDVTIAANKDIVYATGDGIFDASLATGIFKTPTGAHTFGGAVSTSFDITYSAIGKGPILKQGANGRVGTFVANGASAVTVSNTSVAVSDAIIISLNTVGGTVGVQPHIATITGGTGFTVVATASDTSTYNYTIIKNAA